MTTNNNWSFDLKVGETLTKEKLDNLFYYLKSFISQEKQLSFEEGKAEAVREIREEIINLTEPYNGSKWLNNVAAKKILALDSLTPQGDNK